MNIAGHDASGSVATALFAQPDIQVQHRADGAWILMSRTPLALCDPRLGALLERSAAGRPDVAFLCERDASGQWRQVTFAEAWQVARAIGQSLLDRGLGATRPVMVLSGNTVDHGLLMLGCFVAGVPIVPISVAYSLMSSDYAKVTHAIAKTRPGLVHVSSVEPFAKVLGAVDLGGAEVVSSDGSQDTIPLAELIETTPGLALEQAYSEVGAETVAKILFTSGSTGLPKGVVNTHGMLTANQQMLSQIWPFTEREPPVLLDWLPWSHTFGGNHNFNLVLRAGGTLFIDAGRPVPGLIEQTVANLRDVSPTTYFNVPAGFAALLPYLENDDDLAARFLSRLRLVLYAAAALPQALWDRFDALARRVLGRPVAMTSSWGSTETAPLATSAHFPLDRPGSIGVPVPGVTIKLASSGNKLELFVQGPNVTPGYVGEPELTAAAFDAEGFYRIGDAGRFDDPDDPARGIVFDGRVAEDFKLMTGTWVSVTEVRVGIVTAAAPLLQDAVITGHDGPEVGVLAWVSIAGAQGLFGSTGDSTGLVRSEEVSAYLRKAIDSYNEHNPASSSRIGRLLVLTEPPSIDHNEITDKGYINQRAVRERRASEVARLHADVPDDDVLVFPGANG
jgi:feruloyl-CoA synthase